MSSLPDLNEARANISIYYIYTTSSVTSTQVSLQHYSSSQFICNRVLKCTFLFAFHFDPFISSFNITKQVFVLFSVPDGARYAYVTYTVASNLDVGE